MSAFDILASAVKLDYCSVVFNCIGLHVYKFIHQYRKFSLEIFSKMEIIS